MTTTVSGVPASGSRQSPPPRGPDPAKRGWLRPLLLRLHFYAGLLVGPFVLVAALSGALYALTPSIEQVVYDRELHVPVDGPSAGAGGSGAAAPSLTEQVAAAREYLAGRGEDADADLSAVRPAPEPGDTTRVMFTEPGLGSSESRAVFVDPGSGDIRGDLTVYGTSGALPLRTWVDQLHRNLHLGDPGRLYSELAASWLGIVALAGIGLWIAHFRRVRARRDLLRPALRRTGYRRLFSAHASLGLWVLLGALFLSATGITWSQYAGANVGDLRAAIGWGTPALNTVVDAGEAGSSGAGDPAGGDHAEHGGASGSGGDEDGGHTGDHSGHAAGSGPGESPVGAADGTALPDVATFDDVLAAAQAVNVDTGLVEIRPPAEPGTAWVVQEIQRSHPTEVDGVAIDGATLAVVDRTDFSEFPVGAKLARWGIDLHMGSHFGVANQVVLFLVASGIATMVVLGYRMWWTRRPTTSRAVGGPPPRRGVLRDAPWWGLLAVAGAGVAIGLFFPLVGYTLAAFVVVDVIVGLVRRRRAGAVMHGG